MGRTTAQRYAQVPVARQIDETAVDQLAEAILRMLGVPSREATRIAARQLPDITAW